MMWISRKLTFPLDINSLLWQGCTFRAQSNSLRGFDGYGETGKHHLSLGKASQSTRRAPLWSHKCRSCHLSGSLHDGSPCPSGDVHIASEALNFSPEPEFRSLFLVYFRNKIREKKPGELGCFLQRDSVIQFSKELCEIHLIHLPQSRILWPKPSVLFPVVMQSIM